MSLSEEGLATSLQVTITCMWTWFEDSSVLVFRTVKVALEVCEDVAIAYEN